jgi:KUP system potassium uptake protein
MSTEHKTKLTAAGVLITIGIVFGDIGTSPLYVFQPKEKISLKVLF